MTFFIMKLHSVIYNQLSAEAYRPVLRSFVECWLRYWWTCGQLHKCHWRGVQHKYYRMSSYDMWSLCFSSLCVLYSFILLWAFYWKSSLGLSALLVASEMTSRARLHRLADKRHSPGHSEVQNSPVTKIPCIYRVIQNKRAKIEQDIGDAPLNNMR